MRGRALTVAGSFPRQVVLDHTENAPELAAVAVDGRLHFLGVKSGEPVGVEMC